VKPLAIVTKFYNEPAYLPLWLGHYGRQVGLANCYLLDHGTDDGSARALGAANVIRLIRSPQNDYHHLRVIKTMCAELLTRYRYVLHVDLDEFVVADPAAYGSLADYAARCESELISMIGLELQHIPDREAPLDPSQPILAQRRHVWFNSALCKPNFTRGPLDWSPGFHCMKADTVFDDLYLFHLRYVDRDIGLQRLHRSRSQPWSHPDQASHQRLTDERWLAMLHGFASPDRLSDITAERQSAPLRAHLDRVIESRAGRETQDYRIDLSIHSPALWRTADRFSTIF
jgi:hypothetical protein